MNTVRWARRSSSIGPQQAASTSTSDTMSLMIGLDFSFALRSAVSSSSRRWASISAPGYPIIAA